MYLHYSVTFSNEIHSETTYYFTAHQKAKPAYVNPIPWQSIVDIDADEAQENAFNDKKGNINQLKMSGRKTIAAHH